MVDRMYATQNKLGYWIVTEPFLSMRRDGNARLTETTFGSGLGLIQIRTGSTECALNSLQCALGI